MAVAITALVFAASGGAYAAAGGPAAHASAASHANATTAKKKKPKTGPRGPRGFTGPAGHTGPAGATGATGTTGTTGAKGATGATGSQGIQGLVGSTGAAGPSHIVTWLVQNVPTGPGGASGPEVKTLATVGPFTLLGKCTSNGTIVTGQNYIRTSQTNSMESDNTRSTNPVFSPTTNDGLTQPGGTNVTGDIQIGAASNNTGVAQFLEGPRGNATAAMSADGLTFLTAFTSSGVIGSGTSATCYFAGYLMSNAVS
jgi:hypothetical protein